MTNKVLIVIAMAEESLGHFENVPNCDVIHCGVGKINATYALTKAISRQDYDLVINLGTAGGVNINPDLLGTIVGINRFFQRDMDVRPLGFALGQTPNEEHVYIDFNPAKPRLNVPFYVPHFMCSTADSFNNNTPSKNVWELCYDDVYVSDMEAYALARVCQLENIDFVSFKYISDMCNESSNVDWVESLHNASIALRQFLNMYLISR